MTDRPITPTRIIPAGAPLPDRPPGPGDVPPWRNPPAPPAPPPPPMAMPWPEPPPPGPIEVVVTFLPAEEPPEPSRWERLWTWVTSIARPWKITVALFAAVFPIPGVGYSAASVWAYTVGQARTEVGITWAYGLGIVPLVISARALHHTRALRYLVAAAIALSGLLLGALSPFDVVTILTGVAR